MTANLAVQLTIYFATFSGLAMADTFYCDNEFCRTPDKYCCGPNECCTYYWTLWYLWLAFACIVALTLFAFWKYYQQKHGSKSNSKRINDLYNRNNVLNTSFGGHSGSSGAGSAHRGSTSSSLLHSMDYKPLNDAAFVENQLDDDTIEFSIIKD